MTIRITQVTRSTGDVYVTIQYSQDGDTVTVVVDAGEVVDRLKQLRGLVGRPLTLTDLKNVVVALINEVRAGRQPLVETFRYEDYIGVDLEA